MVYARRPLRWILECAWRYATPILLSLSAFGSFRDKNDVQGIVFLLLATGYVFLLVASHIDYPDLKRGLAALAYAFTAFGMLATFGGDSRRVAPVLNQVLPYVGLEVNRSWREGRR